MHNIFRKISVILRFVSPYEFDIKEYRNGQIGGLYCGSVYSTYFIILNQ